MNQFISFFDNPNATRELVGGKGLSLVNFTKHGFKVPEGFTITTDAFHEWNHTRSITPTLENQIIDALGELEIMTSRQLGKENNSLLVSVRSGAPRSMPGMMDTICNVGSNLTTIKGLSESYDEAFAYNLFDDFIKSYSRIVFDKELSERKKRIIKFSPLLKKLTGKEKFAENIHADDWSWILGKDWLINQHKILEYQFNHKIRFQGFQVEATYWDMVVKEGEEYKDHQTKLGTIELITEDYIDFIWANGAGERIPFERIDKSKNKDGVNISIKPQIKKEIYKIINEEKTFGELTHDITRFWNSSNIPKDPVEQVLQSVDSVFKSWYNDRAEEYRKGKNIPADLGTAVTIQRMIFGNCHEQSGTAVVFSSNLNTGTHGIQGNYILNSQGEGLVSGEKEVQNIKGLKSEIPTIFDAIKIKKKEYGSLKNAPDIIPSLLQNSQGIQNGDYAHDFEPVGFKPDGKIFSTEISMEQIKSLAGTLSSQLGLYNNEKKELYLNKTPKNYIQKENFPSNSNKLSQTSKYTGLFANFLKKKKD